MISIQELIRQYKVREAFWALIGDIGKNDRNRALFCRILSFKNNVALLQPDLDKIKDLAVKGGNPHLAYAYARLHDVLQIEENSDRIKEKYYKVAAGHGIGDACAFLAYMYRDGDLGEQDFDSYDRLMQEALQMRSEKAHQQLIRDLVFGTNGSRCNPGEARRLAEKYLKDSDSFPNPAYYSLMAEADLQLGRRTDAIDNFRNAAAYGCSSAFYWWAMAECCDEGYNIVDRSRFMEIMQKGIDVRAADCFLMYPLLLDEKSYDGLNDEARAEVSGGLQKDLTTGWMLGECECCFFMADYYENGRFGFVQDYDKAWLWYSRGAALRSYICLEALARMILNDGTAPSTYNENFAYECAYRGLLLGSEELLEVVVRGFRNGFLAGHADLIESKWLPKYEKDTGEYDDGYEYLLDGEEEREIEED